MRLPPSLTRTAGSSSIEVDEREKLELNASMYLVICPTELEIAPIRKDPELLQDGDVELLVAGPGMVDSSISLTRALCREPVPAGHRRIEGVILFGIGGAYLDSGADILDFCIASSENFGDFGIAAGNEVLYFDNPVMRRSSYDLRNRLFGQVKRILEGKGIPYKQGSFVTVNSCSGTARRGAFLRDRFDAICENMEGAALAQVTEEWSIPFVEVRCISNLVEDRDESKWKISEAIGKGSSILRDILLDLVKAGE